MRGEGHLFLTAYVAVPLGALLILRLAAGEPLFARGSGGRVGRFLTRRALATTAVCLVIGMTGVYYAVFTLLLLCSVAVLRALGGHLRALAPAAVISLLIAGTLAVNYLPAIVYRLEHGSNQSAFMRVPSNSESNAFRLTDLVLPITHHRIKPLADMRQTVESTEDPTPSEARSSSLGLVGVIGFTYLAVVLLGAALGGGRWRAAPMRLRHAGVATSVAFLYGTLGGISALVAYEITPVLHGPARISPFIAFFSFLAVGALLDGLARRTGATRHGPVLLAFALAAVLVVGTFDQTTKRFVPAYAEQARAWASTKAFVSDVERRLPPGASVFQLPIVEFPEGTPPSPTVSGYDNVSLYLHSHHLRWSYGAMRGRPGDWQARLNGADPTGVAEAAAQAGFHGIEVDRLAYTDVASRVVNELAELLGPPVVSSRDGRWVFYDLRPYARLVRAPVSAGVPAGYRLPPRLEFDAGFYAQEGPSTQPFRWEQALGRVQIVNLTKPVRRVLLTGVAYAAASATVRVTGAGVAHAFSATPDGTRFRIALDAPPGRTTLAIANDAPPGGAPGDPRDLRVRFVNLALVRG
jgi:phosphoglycerol transferase